MGQNDRLKDDTGRYAEAAPYEYWVASLLPISHEKKRHVCELTGGAKRFYRMSADQLARLHLFTEKETACILKAQREQVPETMWQEFFANFRSGDMRFLTYNHTDYPERMRHIYNAPYAIFVKGVLPSDRKKSVAVVGARSCSEYGRSVARMIGRSLSEHGVQVVSGMAVGVDCASHAGALEAGGNTFAVLGCGCDICYPKSSRNIYENIPAANGGIISEQLPGTQPQPYFFPLRNRIISALADIVVIVEARQKSGSLITADFALEQGRDVYAVPGRYLDNLSVGCNRLIEQGAGIFVDMESFLKNIGVAGEGKKERGGQILCALSEEEERVYACLDLSVKSIGRITEQSGLDLLSVLDALDVLKKNHLAQETVQNYFSRKL